VSAPTPASPFAQAALACALFAVDPVGLGVALRGAPGEAREAWLATLASLLPEGAPLRRIPADIADDRLIGGLDIAATLASGRAVAEPGALPRADGGALVLSMAERASAGLAARLAAALDWQGVRIQRDGFSIASPARIGLVALDEGIDDERPPVALIERMAMFLDLSAIRAADIAPSAFTRADVARARTFVGRVDVPAKAVEALVAAADAMGVASPRATLFALRLARAHAALRGAKTLSPDDLKLAAALALAPRATRAPPSDGESQPEPPPQEPQSPDDAPAPEDTPDSGPTQAELNEIVLAAARAALPADLLTRLELERAAKIRAARDGKSGASSASKTRGRPIGARSGSPREGRLSLYATLAAAAPWQRVRGAALGQGRIHVRAEDFRIRRFQQKRGTTVLFAVDASGSAAAQRLAEAKGAVELLLADCYVRRDSVALVAFRSRAAEIILPPTRSTARAKKRLAGLPGGGGTPLAAGLDATRTLAERILRKGETPLIVLMTDGRANIAGDGSPGREKAMEDALLAARRMRALGIAMLAIDTSGPGRAESPPPTQRVAQAMGASYIKLPVADAGRVNAAVRAMSGR